MSNPWDIKQGRRSNFDSTYPCGKREKNNYFIFLAFLHLSPTAYVNGFSYILLYHSRSFDSGVYRPLDKVFLVYNTDTFLAFGEILPWCTKFLDTFCSQNYPNTWLTLVNGLTIVLMLCILGVCWGSGFASITPETPSAHG